MKISPFIKFAVVFASLMAVATPSFARDVYRASAYCGIADVTGYSSYNTTRAGARLGAINDCVTRGGVRSCCARTAQVINTRAAYQGYARCSLTGAVGRHLAFSSSEARQVAIATCVRNGGIASCCRNGSRVGR